MSGGLDIVDDRLSDVAIAAELARRQALLAAVAGATGPATRAVLAWWLGERRFATPLDDLYAVSGAVTVTAVPGAPAAMIGVFARRGVIHSLFDPAAALGVPASGTGGTILLLRQDKPRLAIRIDRADGVIDVAADALSGDGLARIIVPADGGTVSIVDTARLIGHLTGQPSSVSPEG